MGETQFSVEVTHNLDELVQRGVAAIVAATEAMADELRGTHIPDEAPKGATGALSSEWSVREADPLTLIVSPPGEAWYAHIVARGRRGVEPTRRRALTIDGEFAAHAGPASGDPFHDRAVARMEQRGDALIEAALADQGL